MKSIDYYICFFMSLFISTSNFFVYKISVNKDFLDINYTNRAIGLVIFFIFSIFLLFSVKKIKKSVIFIVFFIFILYSILIDLFQLSENSSATLLRWISYFCIFCFFSCSNKAIQYLKFIVVFTSIFFAVSTILLYFQGWYLDINGGQRATSIFGSPIGLASFLYVSSLILHFYFLRREIKPILYMLAQLFIFIAILLTVTRLITVVFIFSYLFISLSAFKFKTREIMLLLISLIVLSSIFYYVLNETSIGTRLDKLFSDGLEEDSSTLFRFFLLNTILSKITSLQLFLGIGLGQFSTWFYNISGIENVAPHFEFVWLIVEMGFLGSILYLFYYYLILKRIILFHSKKIKSTLFLVCFSQFIGLQLSNPAYFYQIMFLIFGIQGLICNKTIFK